MSYRKQVLEEHKTEPYHRMRQMLTFHLAPPVCALLAYLELGLIGTPYFFLIMIGVVNPAVIPLVLWFWNRSLRNEWFKQERNYLAEHADWKPSPVYRFCFVPIIAVVIVPLFLHKREIHLLKANKDKYVS